MLSVHVIGGSIPRPAWAELSPRLACCCAERNIWAGLGWVEHVGKGRSGYHIGMLTESAGVACYSQVLGNWCDVTSLHLLVHGCWMPPWAF